MDTFAAWHQVVNAINRSRPHNPLCDVDTQILLPASSINVLSISTETAATCVFVVVVVNIKQLNPPKIISHFVRDILA